MDPDDQHLVGKLEFDVDSLQMEPKESGTDSDSTSNTNTHWLVKHVDALVRYFVCKKHTVSITDSDVRRTYLLIHVKIY